ncbi:MAG: 50S ribosomal protein L22 [Bacteroidales bacterium]|nr:50S ribosomal protein L22 [Bacteroidales bacterium]
MGSNKRIRAENRKEQRKKQYFAVLKGCPTSPRKVRLLADEIRGKEVNQALDFLRFNSRAASIYLEKLLLSAISNWQNKNEGVRIEESYLIVSEIRVDKAQTLKRIRPEAMGRAHLIRKRSSHITLFLENMNEARQVEQVAEDTETESNKQNVNETQNNQE